MREELGSVSTGGKGLLVTDFAKLDADRAAVVKAAEFSLQFGETGSFDVGGGQSCVARWRRGSQAVASAALMQPGSADWRWVDRH